MEFDLVTFDAILYGIMQSNHFQTMAKIGVYDYQRTHDVFQYYFEKYEKHMHKPHPHIKREQISRIARDIPFIKTENGAENILPEDYPIMIDLHFVTNYRNCDYNINHFFSGKIREMRFYEMLAGYRVKGTK